METIRLLFMGFGEALIFQNIIAAFVGAMLGLVIGALPGLGSTAGVALLLPLTFKMQPTTAIIMLAALYYANMYGGSFSAILINIPGDSPAVMTALDGYQLTKKGKAGKALFAASWSSFLGGGIGIVILTFLGPSVARWGLRFGPPEMAWLIILGLTSIGWVIGDNPRTGLLATAVGGMLAVIGMAPSTGRARFTFDILYLMNGISFVPLVIGMFGFSQVIEMVIHRKKAVVTAADKLTIKESLLSLKEIKEILPVNIRSGLLGGFVGVLPGAGATLAAFFGYIAEKRIGKKRDEMGSGVFEGVAAPESANNAASVCAFAPMLALGIPGSTTAAVLMGGLMMWGLTPGPLLFKQKPDFVWGLISSMYIGNLICLVVAIAVIPFLIKVIKIPNSILIPVISSICVMGAYSTNMRMFDVYVMLAAGAFAYLMSISKLPSAPLLLSFVLVPFLERYVSSSVDIGVGNLSIFLRSWLSRCLIVAIVVLTLAPTVAKKITAFKKRGAEE